MDSKRAMEVLIGRVHLDRVFKEARARFTDEQAMVEMLRQAIQSEADRQPATWDWYDLAHAAATVIQSAFAEELAGIEAERDALTKENQRLDDLVKTYRRAQLTAEEKLCRMTASEQGWRRRCEHLEARQALGGN